MNERHFKIAFFFFFSFLVCEGELSCRADKYAAQPQSMASIQVPQMDESAPLGRHSIATTAQWRAKITLKKMAFGSLANGIYEMKNRQYN